MLKCIILVVLDRIMIIFGRLMRIIGCFERNIEIVEKTFQNTKNFIFIFLIGKSLSPQLIII